MAFQGRLIIVCGLPGSGKTTYAKTIEGTESGIRFSPDEWMMALSINLHEEQMRFRIEALQWRFCQQLLAHGLTIILEWGTWGRFERDTLRTRAKEIGATVELHHLSAPTEVLFERIQKRGVEDPPITLEEVNQWSEIFEAPTAEEMALFDAVKLCDGRTAP